MSVLPPSDQAVREQALDPTRSFIVEAPAGSGKTELLTRRFLRLLACVESPEEILAITFTRKAAAEMRGRILKALALAEHDTPPEDPLKRATWSLARMARDTDKRRGWQLCSHPARLRIMTIDALNSMLAKQLPIFSGAGAALNIARDPRALYEEVSLRIIERLGARNETADAIARLLQRLDNQFDIFSKLLSNELARREHWLDLGLLRFELPALRERLEAAMDEVITSELALVLSLVPRDLADELTHLATHAAAVLNSLGSGSAITACDALTALPEASSGALDHWRGIAELLLTKEGLVRSQVNKNTGFPPDDKAIKKRMAELLESLRGQNDLAAALHFVRFLPEPRYSDEQWQALVDLLHVLRWAIAEFELVVREGGEADYPAVAIAARRALGSIDEPTDLALRLDYRLQHLLVDEFQDTSHGQVALLELLTAGWTDGDGRTLFCVGDPMQSIYRFRHADVGLFLHLKQHGLNQLKLTPLRLGVNFRSAKPVIDWINRAFAQVLPLHDDPERGAVAFTASETKPNAAESGGVFVHAIAGEKEAGRLEEARSIADLIVEKQTADADASIAVLVSSRSHLRWVIRELRSRSIAFQAVEIDPLHQRPAIQDLIALTRALVHLADRTAWLAILRAPWCGIELADLYRLCGDETVAKQTIWSVLSDARQLEHLPPTTQSRLIRTRTILEHALAARGRMSLRDCVERAWHALGGPATVANEGALQDCAAYFDRLELLERNGDIEDIARLEDALRDLFAVPETLGGTQVELMTIHRAKGLEFDVVILPALDAGTSGDDPPLLRAQELSRLGASALLLAPIAPRGADNDPIYAWLGRIDKERARFEKARLLYVAATRAERELHLFGALPIKSSGQAKPRANTFLQLLWAAVADEYSDQTYPALDAPLSTDTTSEVRRGIQTRRLPLEWQAPEPLEAVSATASRSVIEDQPLHPEFEWVSETGRHVGTLVHREIERIARDGGDAFGVDELLQRKPNYSVALAELGVPPQLREAAVDRVVTALTNMLTDQRGRWLLAGEGVHREAASELALSGAIRGELVNGVIDRTLVDVEGTRWIVDFKTSTHEGGGLEEFLASEEERYRPQLTRYAQLMRGFRPSESVKAALYFPLLKVWREVVV